MLPGLASEMQKTAFLLETGHHENELTLFDFNDNSIRVIDKGGEPWFPAKDVCDALGLSNASQNTAALPAHQKQTVTKSNLTNSDDSFPNRGMVCVSKSGLFRMLFWSRKPAALEFQDWVTDVVLPAIEKDGMYVRDEEKVETEEDILARSARALEGLQKKLKRKTEELEIVSERVTEVQRTIHHVARQM